MDDSKDVLPAPSDPRARDHREKPNFAFGERDYVDHRQVYVGIHMPRHGRDGSSANGRRNGRDGTGKSRPTKHYNYRKKRGGQSMPKHSEESLSEGEDFIAPASERVKFILGTCDEGDEVKHELFTELEEFVVYEDGNEEWKETARWYKYEEDVEEGGDRWSKPHVATLSLYSLFELRSNLLSGTVILDLEADDLSQIADRVLENLVSCNKLDENSRARVRETILKRHRHQRPAGLKKGLSNIIGRRGVNNGSALSSGSQAKRLNSLNSSNSISKLQNQDISTSSVPNLAKRQISTSLSSGQQTPSQNSGNGPSIPHSASFVRSDSVHGHLVYQGPLPTIPAEDNDKLSGFMKKLPPNAEASNVLVGEVDYLGKSITAFVRLHKGATLGDLTEIPIPTRFLFIMLGPICSHPGQYHEIGRAISTLLADEVFHDVAYKAKSRDDLIAGIDEFLEQVTVLPPGEWDPSIRIDPPLQSQSKELRRPALDHRKNDLLSIPTGKQSSGSDNGINYEGDGLKFWERTRRPFGGLKADLINWKRRCHDIRDGFHIQSLGTVFFLYFISLALICTLGEHQTSSTTSFMGKREYLLALVFGGGLTSLFGGQPLVLVGLAMPLVRFEELLHDICEVSELNYFAFRFWMGLFSSLLIVLLVSIDASVFARYFTRFSQEIYLSAVAINLIYIGFSWLHGIGSLFPVQHEFINPPHGCVCSKPTYTSLLSNVSLPQTNSSAFNRSNINMTIVSTNFTNWVTLNVPFKTCEMSGGVLVGDACSYNVYFLSVILMAVTIAVAYILIAFKSTGYLPKVIRQIFGDFATFIAVLIASVIAYNYDISVPTVELPLSLYPHESDRSSWVVDVVGDQLVWTILAGLVASVPLVGLFFVEYHLTALIVNRQDNKLKKSFGYHQDFVLMSLLVFLCSLLGLPYIVTSCILSVNHVHGLHLDDTRRKSFSGIREQKLTALLLTVLYGISPIMMPALKYIPKPSLYGILVYAALRLFTGSKVLERLKVMLMAPKHQPDRIYLRQMPTITVHIFTVVQLICIAVLLPIRSSIAAVVFPFVVFLLVVMRALLELLLPHQFVLTLDDAVLKAFWRHRLCPSTQEDPLLSGNDSQDNHLAMMEMGSATNEVEDCLIDGSNMVGMATPIANGCAPVNISEELSKTAVWKQLVKDDSTVTTPRDSPLSGSPQNHRKRRRKYPRAKGSKKETSSSALPTIIKTDCMRKEENSPPPPPPWCEPYLSPPRADTKYLSMCGNDVSVDPACSRSGSKTPSYDEASIVG